MSSSSSTSSSLGSLLSLFFVDQFPLVIPYGVSCLVAHFGLVILFRYVGTQQSSSSSSLSTEPWREVPHFTAHQIVALYLMIAWTVQGFQEYYYLSSSNDNEQQQQNDDELRLLQIIPGGIEMAQKSMAALWIWDIPVMTFCIERGSNDNSHADLIMHLHHIGMLIITFIMIGLLSFDEVPPTYFPFGQPIGSCYAPIFMGIVELSSIPLQIVDLFHPQKGRGVWYQYINPKNSDSTPVTTAISILTTINETCRQLFAILFLMVRGFFFPYIVCTDVLPNVWLAYQQLYPRYILPLTITVVFSAGFTLLQMYWAVLVVQQIIKALSSPSPKTSEAKANANKND